MSQSKSFNFTPILHRTKSGEPMAYYILSEDGERIKTTRAVCLARTEADDSLPPQRWFVDEESGLVVRLPCTAKSDELARMNMRSVWRDAKREERWAGRIIEPTTDEDGNEVVFEPTDDSKETDVAGVLEETALLDTLYAALADLTQEDRDLIKAIFWGGKTERQLAPELGLKEPKSVNKRKHRILEILRNNDALRSFFE